MGKTLLLVFVLVGLPLLLINISRIRDFFEVYFRYLNIKELRMNTLFSRFESNASDVSDKELSNMFDYFSNSAFLTSTVDSECGRTVVNLETFLGYKASKILEEISKRHQQA
ncbi:MAG: hypothetical protein PHE89_00485 [Alphaproteobacteria bacterium]|nr:hypothetical protein [Alphaproteobacteria bacterium]